MIYQSPDDPNRVSVDFLKKIDEEPPGTWIAQPKYDGWRRPVYIEGGKLTFYSKRGGGEEARKQPPPDLVEELASMNWPDQCALDMEWMGPRCREELRERYGDGDYNGFRIFDITYVDGMWQGSVPFRDRLAALQTIFAAASTGLEVPRIELAPAVDRGLVEMFDETQRDPLVEGVVVRAARSGLVGGKNPRKNPQWLKIKYREIREKAAF
jgi:ATP-dependent DNA ligase